MSLELEIAGITALVVLLYFLDGKRRLRHLRVARDMIESGMSESEAKKRSGCAHWDRSFFLRIWIDYPRLPD
jgi:hypothetical protein